jgi:hypothetical protein
MLPGAALFKIAAAGENSQRGSLSCKARRLLSVGYGIRPDKPDLITAA